ncbi:MAG: hypothetical protein KDC34_19115 [Saprospiraceae bacterium]|nr:hypothetical protein [Saprospiraceae bacterium]
MPNWSEVLKEIQQYAKDNPGGDNPLDAIRRKYLTQTANHTGRNTIAYYSGWLQTPGSQNTAVSDKDKSAFMTTIHGMDRSLGLDLILHTPGGDLAATEGIVDYLRAMFGKNIRAIIPQLSMSAGTMIALSCKEIVMGKQSNLGPIDPQMGGVACQAVIQEFKKAKKDIANNPASAPLWQVIIGKYHPTFIGSCKNAIKWSETLAKDWLLDNMLENDPDKLQAIMKEFGDHKTSRSHARHISLQKCKDLGLAIIEMEDDGDLQDLVLSTHHSYMHTFGSTTAVKIVENQNGVAFIESEKR